MFEAYCALYPDPGFDDIPQQNFRLKGLGFRINRERILSAEIDWSSMFPLVRRVISLCRRKYSRKEGLTENIDVYILSFMYYGILGLTKDDTARLLGIKPRSVIDYHQLVLCLISRLCNQSGNGDFQVGVNDSEWFQMSDTRAREAIEHAQDRAALSVEVWQISEDDAMRCGLSPFRKDMYCRLLVGEEIENYLRDIGMPLSSSDLKMLRFTKFNLGRLGVSYGSSRLVNRVAAHKIFLNHGAQEYLWEICSQAKKLRPTNNIGYSLRWFSNQPESVKQFVATEVLGKYAEGQSVPKIAEHMKVVMNLPEEISTITTRLWHLLSRLGWVVSGIPCDVLVNVASFNMNKFRSLLS